MGDNIRVPSIEDYLNHDGLHYRLLWKEVGHHWICPACGRSKFQIMRWTKRFPDRPNPFMGWVAALHRHHDHSGDFWGRGARFPQTVICDQCNAADGAVKRKLVLPKNFSFAPVEIKAFVTATPHGKHVIHYETAHAIYRILTSTT